MANPRMTLLDLLNKAEQGVDAEFLRDGLKLLAQELVGPTDVGSAAAEDSPHLKGGYDRGASDKGIGLHLCWLVLFVKVSVLTLVSGTLAKAAPAPTAAASTAAAAARRKRHRLRSTVRTNAVKEIPLMDPSLMR